MKINNAISDALLTYRTRILVKVARKQCHFLHILLMQTSIPRFSENNIPRYFQFLEQEKIYSLYDLSKWLRDVFFDSSFGSGEKNLKTLFIPKFSEVFQRYIDERTCHLLWI